MPMIYIRSSTLEMLHKKGIKLGTPTTYSHVWKELRVSGEDYHKYIGVHRLVGETDDECLRRTLAKED